MKQFEKDGFYVDANGVNSTFMDKKHRVQEFAVGTVMPKAVKSAYMFFSIEQHALFKSQMKEGEKYLVVEKTKEISEQWNKMTATKKAKYEKMKEQDEERR